MDDSMLHVLIQQRHSTGQPDNFRTGAENGYYFHGSDLFKECVRIVLVKMFVNPKQGDQLRSADVGNVVCIIDGHLHPRRFIAGDPILDHFVRPDPTQLNTCLAPHHTKFLILTDMIMIAARDAGPGRRKRNSYRTDGNVSSK